MANNRLLTNSLDISEDIATFNLATLPSPGMLGQVLVKNGKVYQCVLLKSTSITAAAGQPVCWSDFDDFTVSAEIDDVKRNFPAGLLLMAATAGRYCFIQVAGPYSTALFDGLTFSSGDVPIMSSTDGRLTRVAAGTAPTYIPFGAITSSNGNAVGTLATGTGDVWLNCPRNY